jgi:hypothetical protein
VERGDVLLQPRRAARRLRGHQHRLPVLPPQVEQRALQRLGGVSHVAVVLHSQRHAAQLLGRGLRVGGWGWGWGAGGAGEQGVMGDAGS